MKTHVCAKSDLLLWHKLPYRPNAAAVLVRGNADQWTDSRLQACTYSTKFRALDQLTFKA